MLVIRLIGKADAVFSIVAALAKAYPKDTIGDIIKERRS